MGELSDTVLESGFKRGGGLIAVNKYAPKQKSMTSTALNAAFQPTFTSAPAKTAWHFFAAATGSYPGLLKICPLTSTTTGPW